MMVVEVVGKRAVHYTSKKTNKPVTGTELHYLAPFSDSSGCEGKRAASIFTRLDCKDVAVGEQYRLEFDLTGSQRAVLSGIEEI